MKKALLIIAAATALVVMFGGDPASAQEAECYMGDYQGAPIEVCPQPEPDLTNCYWGDYQGVPIEVCMPTGWVPDPSWTYQGQPIVMHVSEDYVEAEFLKPPTVNHPECEGVIVDIEPGAPTPVDGVVYVKAGNEHVNVGFQSAGFVATSPNGSDVSHVDVCPDPDGTTTTTSTTTTTVATEDTTTTAPTTTAPTTTTKVGEDSTTTTTVPITTTSIVTDRCEDLGSCTTTIPTPTTLPPTGLNSDQAWSVALVALLSLVLGGSALWVARR
jgi:hypothetical protein